MNLKGLRFLLELSIADTVVSGSSDNVTLVCWNDWRVSLQLEAVHALYAWFSSFGLLWRYCSSWNVHWHHVGVKPQNVPADKFVGCLPFFKFLSFFLLSAWLVIILDYFTKKSLKDFEAPFINPPTPPSTRTQLLHGELAGSDSPLCTIMATLGSVVYCWLS